MSDDNKMPEAVKLAIKELLSAASFYRLEAQRDDRPIAAADNLESWWRNLAQPVAVGGWQLEELLKYADLAEVSLRTGFSPPDFLGVDLPYLLRSSIAAVRQQAAQGRKVELGKVREYFDQLCKLPQYHNEQGRDFLEGIYAELDAAEGKGEGRG